MGLPSKQRTRTSRDQRRSHDALKTMSAHLCPSCKAATRPHHACPSCGTYKGKQAVDIKKRTARRARHQKPLS